MDWSYPTDEMLAQQQRGIDIVIDRLGLDPPPRGDEITFDAAAMMEATRTIEDAVTEGDRLLVGFQVRSKLDAEARRYERLGAVANVLAFGRTDESEHPALVPGVEWIEAGPERRNLENQWFLVLSGSRTLAFVGYEISRPDLVARRGALDPDRTFTGFISDDERIVASMTRYLDAVAIATPGPVAISPVTIDAVRGAQRILVATDDETSPMYARARRLGYALAGEIDAEVILYDRSAESNLTDPYPYPEVVGPERTLDRADVFQLQRAYLAAQIDNGTAMGVHTSAWLPRSRGPKAMTEAIDRFKPEVVILPSELSRPGLRDKLSGNTLAKFRELLHATILLATPEGTLVPDRQQAA